jgi:hypothetical protein
MQSAGRPTTCTSGPRQPPSVTQTSWPRSAGSLRHPRAHKSSKTPKATRLTGLESFAGASSLLATTAHLRCMGQSRALPGKIGRIGAQSGDSGCDLRTLWRWTTVAGNRPWARFTATFTHPAAHAGASTQPSRGMPNTAAQRVGRRPGGRAGRPSRPTRHRTDRQLANAGERFGGVLLAVRRLPQKDGGLRAAAPLVLFPSQRV